MKKPVAMDSNIQTVLFMPETLELWVAYANGDKIASETEPRKFSLMKLLNRVPEQTTPAKKGT